MREWLSWWSTTLPRSGPRVRVPSRAGKIKRLSQWIVALFYQHEMFGNPHNFIMRVPEKVHRTFSHLALNNMEQILSKRGMDRRISTSIPPLVESSTEAFATVFVIKVQQHIIILTLLDQQYICHQQFVNPAQSAPQAAAGLTKC